MIINHNIAALNTHRQLSSNTAAASKSIEKLSSGLRINRAGDDAAGLAISEKMRGQIRGLDMASKNSQDGISLIQTAEGALNETHSILQRMRELAVQSSNDTNTAGDRAKLQSEVDELAKEITRISNTTEFNTQNLMAGGLKSTFHIGANAGQNINLKVGAMDAQALGVAGGYVTTNVTKGNEATTLNVNTSSEVLDGYHVNVAKVAATNTAATATNGSANTKATVTGSYTGSGDVNLQVRVTSKTTGADAVDGAEISTDNGATWTNTTVTGGAITYQGLTVTMDAHTDINAGGATPTTYQVSATAEYLNVQLGSAATGGATVGEAAKMYNNQTSVVVGDLSTDRVATVSLAGTFASSFTAVKATNTTYTANSSIEVAQTTLGSTSATVAADGTVAVDADTKKGINISSQGSANNAITTVNKALETVSSERSKLGAVQNRLEHTINNLNTSSENLTAAESRIRDVDMAKEMMNQTKNSILAQAAQAMLAQANQQPQGVLQLLR